MSLKSGDIVEGKVIKIANYGAFIKLSEDQTGLCHISEISNEYVKDIHDYLEEGKDVKVKILKIKEDGKIELSIKALDKRPKNRPGKPSRPQKKPQESFEDMLSGFLKSSDEKMKNLKQRDQNY